MAGFSNRNLMNAQWEILMIDRVVPQWDLSVFNAGGSARNYKVGTGSSADGPFVGPTLTTLTGTVTLNNGSPIVAGAGTSFDTELAVGDTVVLDDRLIPARVLTVDAADQITLDADWSGATVAGATLYQGTPQDRPLAAGRGVMDRQLLPVDGSGDPVTTHKYMYIEAVTLPIYYDLSVPGPATTVVFPVRDSLAQQSV